MGKKGIKLKKNLLFICSANIDRSPTAERLFKFSEKYEAKSAGIYDWAMKRIDQDLIDWADMIFVLNEKNDKQLSYLKENLNISGKTIYDLDIPNAFKRDDPKLIKLLKEKIAEFLEKTDEVIWK